jgi:hypothetical protein
MATAWTSGTAIIGLVGATSPSAADTAWADRCATAVNAQVDEYLGVDAWAPDPDRDEAIAQLADLAGVEAYKRREAPFGVTGFADLEGAAVRVARDSLEGVKPGLARWRQRTGIA